MRPLLLALLGLALSSPALAATRLAVLELQGKPLTPDELGLMTNTLRGGVVDALPDDVQVMTRENMEVMLTDMGLDASCISEGSCEVETARNLGVDYVVSGDIVAMGGMLIASIMLHETASGQLLETEQVRGESSLALLDGMPGAAGSLVQTLAGSSSRPPEQETAPSPSRVPSTFSTAAWDEKVQQHCRATSEADRTSAMVERTEAIAALKQELVTLAPSGTAKANMLARLAELYFLAGRDWECAGELGNARSEYRRALSIYELIIYDFRTWQHIDSISFSRANILAYLDRGQEAWAAFSELLRDHPTSRFADDTRARLSWLSE